jgi:hypothetical protein
MTKNSISSKDLDLLNNGSNDAEITDNVTLKHRLLPLVESNDFDQLVKDRVKVMGIAKKDITSPNLMLQPNM